MILRNGVAKKREQESTKRRNSDLRADGTLISPMLLLMPLPEGKTSPEGPRKLEIRALSQLSWGKMWIRFGLVWEVKCVTI